MDIAYLLLLQNFREATQNVFSTFFSKITLLGEEYLPYLLMFCLYWCIDKQYGRRVIAGMGLGRIINGVLKASFCVYRPWIRDARVIPYGDSMKTASGYSFPSGHTTNATLGFGAAGWHYRKKKALAFMFFLLVALVMLSRNYLGVHTPQDVIVGAAATFFAIFLGYRLMDWADKGENRLVVLVVCSALISVAVLFYYIHKPYPIDYDAAGKLIVDPNSMIPNSYGDMGMFVCAFLGLVLEKKFANFTTQVSLEDKMLRFAVGGLGYAFCKAVGTAFFKLLLGAAWGELLGKGLMVLYAVGIHPILFTLWEKKKGAEKVSV